MMIKRFMTNKDDNEFLDTQDFLSSNSFGSAESEFCKYHMILITIMLKGLLILKMAWIPALNLLDATILEIAWHGQKRGGGGLWSTIKDNIGKDLSRVHLPVYFNEPIYSLQKCFEDLKYSCRILEETKEILQLYVAAILGWTTIYQSKCCCCKVSVLHCGSVVLKPKGVTKLCFVISILHHFQCWWKSFFSVPKCTDFLFYWKNLKPITLSHFTVLITNICLLSWRSTFCGEIVLCEHSMWRHLQYQDMHVLMDDIASHSIHF